MAEQTSCRKPGSVSSSVRIPPPIRLDQVVKTRFWEFNRGNGQWTVNGRIFREDEIRATVKCNTREICLDEKVCVEPRFEQRFCMKP